RTVISRASFRLTPRYPEHDGTRTHRSGLPPDANATHRPVVPECATSRHHNLSRPGNVLEQHFDRSVRGVLPHLATLARQVQRPAADHAGSRNPDLHRARSTVALRPGPRHTGQSHSPYRLTPATSALGELPGNRRTNRAGC